MTFKIGNIANVGKFNSKLMLGVELKDATEKAWTRLSVKRLQTRPCYHGLFTGILSNILPSRKYNRQPDCWKSGKESLTQELGHRESTLTLMQFCISRRSGFSWRYICELLLGYPRDYSFDVPTARIGNHMYGSF